MRMFILWKSDSFSPCADNNSESLVFKPLGTYQPVVLFGCFLYVCSDNDFEGLNYGYRIHVYDLDDIYTYGY